MNNTFKVGVHDIRVYARVGIYEEERILKNLLSIDLEVEVGKNAHEYEGRKTINYITLIEIVKEAAAHEIRLLEGLADKIIHNIRELHEGASSIHITIRKLHPIAGFNIKDLFVEVKWTGT